MCECKNDGDDASAQEKFQQPDEKTVFVDHLQRDDTARTTESRVPSGRKATGFFRGSVAHFRYIFGSSKNTIDLIDDEGAEQHAMESITDAQLGEVELGLLEDDFQPENIFATGGQANIINARDKQIGRMVALKCLREDCRKSAAARKSILQEAVLTARLEHPSIIPVYRLCRDQECHLHIVMKKIRGKTFGKYLTEVRKYYDTNGIHIFEERAALSRRLDIFLDVCNGLSYAHSMQVIHCDLKPDNVMIGFHHETYIIDWGIARTINAEGVVAGGGKMAGTPRYIAPEVAMGLDYDQRADVFAMGAILFEIVTLQDAFPGDETKDILENICCGKMNPIKHMFGVGIDKALICIIQKATATNPAERYQTIDDLADDIRRYRSGLGIMAKPDNAIQYAFRWMLIHKKLTRWTIQILLIGIIGLGGFSVYRKMEYELNQKRRETSLNTAYTKSLMVVTEINNQLNKMEQLVIVLASETAFMLDHHPYTESGNGVPEGTVPFIAQEAFRGETPPESSILSINYSSRIDFTNLSFNVNGALPAAELEHYIFTLLPFKRQIIGFFILSCYDSKPFTGEEAYLPGNMANSNYSLLWLYLNLANGLQLRYPGTGAFGDDFDARHQPWYLHAQKYPDVVSWSEPYLLSENGNMVVITTAKAITGPRQEFLGVACADVALKEIRRIIEKDESDKYFKKMLLLQDGSILINTANPIAQLKNDKNGNLMLPKFHNQELFEIMRRKKFGVESVWENGRETFYIYSYLERMNWFYVVRVDQDTIRYQAENSQDV